MKKMWSIIGLCTVLAIAVCGGTAMAASGITLIVNGKLAKADVMLQDGVTYVPLRAAAELLDSKVEWKSESRTVVIEKGGEETTPADTQVVKQFIFQQMNVQNRNGLSVIEVDIGNGTGAKVSAVLFTAVFYNDRGERIGNADGAAVDLDKGETKTVHLLTDDQGLQAFASVRYQIEQVL